MKIVSILGSPHGARGATAMLLSEVIRAAQREGASVTSLSLMDQKVQPCCGCDHCHAEGLCSIHDDFFAIRQAMEEADGIILASPNYIFSVSAQMKAMMDRCCGALHCQNLTGKYGAAVVTGGSETQEVQDYLLKFLRVLGCWGVGSVGANARQLSAPDTRQHCFDAAADLGRQLVQAVQEKKTFPHQQPEMQSFYDRMKSLVVARKADWPYEYDYWKSRGRL